MRRKKTPFPLVTPFLLVWALAFGLSTYELSQPTEYQWNPDSIVVGTR